MISYAIGQVEECEGKGRARVGESALSPIATELELWHVPYTLYQFYSVISVEMP